MNNKEKLIDLTYENKLSHLGSCLTALPLIETIFEVKKPGEKFILSNGHAGLALYVVLEEYYGEFGVTAQDLLDRQGIHPDRTKTDYPMPGGYFNPIDCSTGSLGQGLPIAVGMSLADRSKNVYCMVSDGELSEGSIWESLRIAEELRLENLKIIVNVNGYGAYKEIDPYQIHQQLEGFVSNFFHVAPKLLKHCLETKNILGPLVIMVYTNSDIPGFSEGLDSHYKTISEDDYGKIRNA